MESFGKERCDVPLLRISQRPVGWKEGDQLGGIVTIQVRESFFSND